MRRLRPTSLVVTLLAAAALAGCTTESQVCKDGVCKLSMSGKGATATLGGEGGSTIELISAGGTEARVKIAGREGTLRLNEPINLDNGKLTLTEVKDDKVKITIEGSSDSTNSETPSGGASGDNAPS